MDLTTTYMGLKLRNPLVASASPLSHTIDGIKRLEDAGIAAVVNHSLFEEQIALESFESEYFSAQGSETFAESLTYFPKATDYVLGPKEYLDHIARAKKAVKIPVIASLNGRSAGGWIEYARRLEEAGADALELNIYFIPTNPALNSFHVEDIYVGILHSVKEKVRIPVAVKIGPYFSSMAHMARRLDEAGADALVLFNRFYQPDIDLEKLEVVPRLVLSTSQELRLPLRWIAILYGHVKADLAATTGIHTAEDVIKMLLAGAGVTMLCSALLKNGVDYTVQLLKETTERLVEHEYTSLAQLRGSVSQKACANPEAFERANYMKVLQSYPKKRQ